MNKYLQHLLKNIPKHPGIYKMKNSENEILYIGKAKNLRNRVGSYFKKNNQQSVKNQKMIGQIADIEYTVVGSDLEAIMLETNLIKEFRPKYNILMKDDKNFAYIKITTNEAYPRIQVVRKVLNDGAKYFGPKTAASKIYDTLNLFRKIYPFRNCSLVIEDLGPAINIFDKKRLVKVTHAGIKYPCLDLHIKRCLGPCIGKPDINEYQQIIKQIINLLEGKYQDILINLKIQMSEASQQKKFEQAAKIRDKITMIESIFEKQIISSPDHSNCDIINYYPEGEKAFFNIFQIREGKLIDQQNFTINAVGETDPDPLLSSFIKQYYSENTDLPKELIIPAGIKEQIEIKKWLDSLAKQSIKIITPEKGKKDQLLDLCLENAKSFAKQQRTKWEGNSLENRDQALEKLSQYLGLNKMPKRIECYDISHLSGTQTVASMAVFENGFPKTDQYRHFKINRELAGSPDDFASMEEVILRRIKYLKPTLNKNEIKIVKLKLKTSDKEIYTIKENKRIIGKFSLFLSNKLKTFITDLKLNIAEPEIVYRKIIEKFNSKRIYFVIEKKQESALEKIGFEYLHEKPKELTLKPKKSIMVFDKTKHRDDQSFKQRPDLIVIDGGKGQLSSAIKILKSSKIEIPIISLAKKKEEIFIPNKPKSIQLDNNDQARLMLQHIRDEAHRFAIEYNRKLRKNDYTSSQLEETKGIGKIVSKKLLKHFGSIENLKNASTEEISDVIGTKIALKIKDLLN
jgi:excinuclease ABC subunit C